MKRWIAGLVALGVLSGCGNWLPPAPKARAQAFKRWQFARAQVLYGVAMEHLKFGQLAEGRMKVTEALALEGDYTDARVLLAKILIEQGEYRTAAAELTAVQAKAPESDEVPYLLGVAREREGKLEEALQSYRQAHGLNGQNAAAAKAAAEVLVAMNRLPEAQAELEAFTSVGADDPGLYELAARVASMQGQHADAAKYYEQALSRVTENVGYMEALAREHFLAGQYAPAVELLKTLRGMKDYEKVAWVPTMLGDCHMAMNQPFDAREAYEAASETDPKNAAVWTNVASAALAMNDIPRAILSARHAMTLEPGRLDAKLLLGYALLRGRQVERAVSFLNQSVAEHPDNGTLRCLQGRALAAAGDSAAAARCYAAALEAEPGNALAESLLSASAGQGALNHD